MAKAGRKFEVLVLSQIAQQGLKRFAPERYALVKEARSPDVVLVRSHDLHGMEFGDHLRRWRAPERGPTTSRWMP